MLHFFTGTDTEKVRGALDAMLNTHASASILRITDAHGIGDMRMALAGRGMFDSGERVVVFDGVLDHDEMRELLLGALPDLKKSGDMSLIHQGIIDAPTRKTIEKYAETTVRHDAIKEKERETIFGLVNALQRGNKKDLWVGYQREIAKGKAPEAIHGMLFYAAKDALLKNPRDERARRLVAQLAELPHEARRQGFELEYALEHFALSGA